MKYATITLSVDLMVEFGDKVDIDKKKNEIIENMDFNVSYTDSEAHIAVSEIMDNQIEETS